MNPKWYAIPTPQEGRRFAVGDIHGCNLTLQALVKEQLQLTKQDQLFLLGDYVNRGPDSMGVLQFIMGLQAEGYQVFALRGNHEQMLLDKISMRDRLSQDTVLMGYTSLARSINQEQQAWLEALPYFFALNNFYLVHGAIDTSVANPLENYKYMLWERETHHAGEFLRGKQLIFGHTKYMLTYIKRAVEERHDCIPLDNGCYMGCKEYNETREFGSLCALDLDAWQLYVQENVD